MSWAFQGVANACIQILLLIAVGYGMTWRGWVGDKFLPQANTFLLLISFPSLNLNSIGINLDLQDAAGWKAIAAYIMWLTIIQACIVVWVWLFAKRDVGEAALLNLLLSANNTVIIGLPLMDATFGTTGRYISLLTAVPLFVQVMPFSIILFEMEKWILQEAVAAGSSSDNLAGIAGQPPAATPLPGSSNSLAELIHPTESVSLSEDGLPSTMPASAHGHSLLPSAGSTGSVAQADPHTNTSAGVEATNGVPIAAPAVQAGMAGASDEFGQQGMGQAAVVDGAAGVMPAHTSQYGPPATSPTHGLSGPSMGMQAVSTATGAGGLPAAGGAAGAGAGYQKRTQQLAVTIGDVQPPVVALSGMDETTDQLHTAGSSKNGGPDRPHHQHHHHHPHRLSHQTGPDDLASDVAEVPAAGPQQRHSNQQQQHKDGELPASGPASPAGKPLTKSYSFTQQWHAAVQHLAELKKRRKQLKQQRRQMVSVVDVPLFTNPEVQLGQGHMTHTAGHGGHHYHSMDEASPRGASESAGRRDNPWVALNRLLSRGRLSMSRLANSFGRRHDIASVLPQFDHEPGHNLENSLPTYHTNPLAAQHAASGMNGYGAATAMVSRSDPSAVRSQVVEKALRRAVTKHGGFVWVVAQYAKVHTRLLVKVVLIICKNPMLWTLLLAVVISASGLRQFLDPKSHKYVIELGWLVQALAMCSGTTVPLALFSNGVFLYGKRFWEGNLKKAAIIVTIKIVVLPALQLLCAKLLRLETAPAMALVLLSVCPCATTAFVVASQYNHGTEVITLCTIVLTVLLVPLMLAALNLPKALGLYDFDTAAFPLP